MAIVEGVAVYVRALPRWMGNCVEPLGRRMCCEAYHSIDLHRRVGRVLRISVLNLKTVDVMRGHRQLCLVGPRTWCQNETCQVRAGSKSLDPKGEVAASKKG